MRDGSNSAKLAVILGDDDLVRRQQSLKNLSTGEQQMICPQGSRIQFRRCSR